MGTIYKKEYSDHVKIKFIHCAAAETEEHVPRGLGLSPTSKVLRT